MSSSGGWMSLIAEWASSAMVVTLFSEEEVGSSWISRLDVVHTAVDVSAVKLVVSVSQAVSVECNLGWFSDSGGSGGS
jgi:hypothetical protein